MAKQTLSDKALVDKFLKEQVAKLQERDWTKPKQSTVILNTEELKTGKFSGFRMNDLSRQVELWLLGQVVDYASYARVSANPGLLATMHERSFATAGTIIIVDEPKDKGGH